MPPMIATTPNTIGSRLRQLRMSKGLSQSTTAAALHITQTTYSAWELNRVDIPSSRLTALAELFGVSIDHLLGHEEEPTHV